jgi:ATP-dependent DNA helicase DinG
VVISTGTKNLQDQLYSKDLPVIRKVLRKSVSTALLKGRSNYLCLYRMKMARVSGELNSVMTHQVEEINDWSGRTKTGDIAELNQIPENSPIWPRVTSTVDNCLGAQCADYEECFVARSRKNAMEADVVVINHHILLADMVLKDTGFGELLPEVDGIVVDEAHQLPDIAVQFFGETLSYRQLNELGQDLLDEGFDLIDEDPEEKETPTQLLQRFNRLADLLRSELLRGGRNHNSQNSQWRFEANSARVKKTFQELQACLQTIQSKISHYEDANKGLLLCEQRCALFLDRMARLQEPDDDSETHAIRFQSNAFIWSILPISIAEQFNEKAQQYDASWVFTSATLAIGDSFDHFIRQLGVHADHTVYLKSPFDYEQNALLYLPKDLPEPQSQHYVQTIVDHVRPLIESCPGGVFFLFTSHRALNIAAQLFRNDDTGIEDRSLLIQGDAPRADLLNDFRDAGDALLLGTYSFWEGVDVRGKALSCVIIDKLPFASPEEPMLRARIENCRQHDGNPFFEIQLPQAVIALKQGVGRLIRDENDKGLLVLCDPRLVTKNYGRMFLNSLPEMPKTQSMQQAQSFLEQLAVFDDIS